MDKRIINKLRIEGNSVENSNIIINLTKKSNLLVSMLTIIKISFSVREIKKNIFHYALCVVKNFRLLGTKHGHIESKDQNV